MNKTAVKDLEEIIAYEWEYFCEALYEYNTEITSKLHHISVTDRAERGSMVQSRPTTS